MRFILIPLVICGAAVVMVFYIAQSTETRHDKLCAAYGMKRSSFYNRDVCVDQNGGVHILLGRE